MGWRFVKLLPWPRLSQDSEKPKVLGVTRKVLDFPWLEPPLKVRGVRLWGGFSSPHPSGGTPHLSRERFTVCNRHDMAYWALLGPIAAAGWPKAVYTCCLTASEALKKIRHTQMRRKAAMLMLLTLELPGTGTSHDCKTLGEQV